MQECSRGSGGVDGAGLRIQIKTPDVWILPTGKRGRVDSATTVKQDAETVFNYLSTTQWLRFCDLRFARGLRCSSRRFHGAIEALLASGNVQMQRRKSGALEYRRKRG